MEACQALSNQPLVESTDLARHVDAVRRGVEAVKWAIKHPQDLLAPIH
jgi:hypothetical protein